MKLREHFTVSIAITTGRQHLGDLEIDGIAYCRTREDVESYSHDIEAYRFRTLDGQYEQVSGFTKALIESGDMLLDIGEVVTAHVAKIFGNYEPADSTTDLRQENVFEAMASILKPNNAA